MSGLFLAWTTCAVASIIPWGIWYGVRGILIQSVGLLGMVLLLINGAHYG